MQRTKIYITEKRRDHTLREHLISWSFLAAFAIAGILTVYAIATLENRSLEYIQEGK